jgi:hypothetical protein
MCTHMHTYTHTRSRLTGGRREQAAGEEQDQGRHHQHGHRPPPPPQRQQRIGPAHVGVPAPRHHSRGICPIGSFALAARDFYYERRRCCGASRCGAGCGRPLRASGPSTPALERAHCGASNGVAQFAIRPLGGWGRPSDAHRPRCVRARRWWSCLSELCEEESY